MTTFRDACMEAQAEFHAHEMDVDTSDRPWLRWLSRVEKLTGLDDLDGDGREDGYSLDQCYDWFEARWTAERAAAQIIASVRARV